jgi:TonB family protein
MTVRPTLINVADVQRALLREYPALLRDAGIGGVATVSVYIDAEGAVTSTHIFETSGYAPLDAAAQNVAMAMRFTPAQNRNELVPVWVQIPIRFQVVN